MGSGKGDAVSRGCIRVLINTPLQRGGAAVMTNRNRFNGFSR
jgi:hypothetical protein